MDFNHLLIASGAGFVGSTLAILFGCVRPDLSVTLLDSLKRRGGKLQS